MTEHTFGVSFSLHRCSELGLNKKAVLRAALEDLAFRRFRLMSYWNIHEQQKGRYDFSELDWQLALVAKYGGTVSLCLGKRQPRWPECHAPEWIESLSKAAWYQALFDYIEAVVKRYRGHPVISSWQLENEALLREFGHCPDGDFSHERLRQECMLVKRLDPNRPVIMTLSDSWGLPWRRPLPDMFATSLYRITINKRGAYTFSKRPAEFYALRAALIRLLRFRPTFIHELQAEPWLSKPLLETPLKEQLRYMNSQILTETLQLARRTGLRPIDLWGLEWWYWLKHEQNHPEIWESIKALVRE